MRLFSAPHPQLSVITLRLIRRTTLLNVNLILCVPRRTFARGPKGRDSPQRRRGLKGRNGFRLGLGIMVMVSLLLSQANAKLRTPSPELQTRTPNREQQRLTANPRSASQRRSPSTHTSIKICFSPLPFNEGRKGSHGGHGGHGGAEYVLQCLWALLI
jgi:hypothetical protein